MCLCGKGSVATHKTQLAGRAPLTYTLLLLNMPSESITKLNETNYDTWSLVMKALLVRKDLWDIIDGSEPRPPAIPIQKPFGLMRKRFNKLMLKSYSTLNQTSTLMSGKEDLLRSGRACAKCTLHADLPHGSRCISTFLR